MMGSTSFLIEGGRDGNKWIYKLSAWILIFEKEIFCSHYRPQTKFAWRGGACVAGWGRAWQGACVVGGTCMARGACMPGRACVVVGCAWQGGVCGRGVCKAGGGHGRYYEIRSMSGWYTSYWNTFLFSFYFPVRASNLIAFEVYNRSVRRYIPFIALSVYYMQLLAMVSQLEKELCCSKRCWGVYEQNIIVCSIRLDDWTAKWTIIALIVEVRSYNHRTRKCSYFATKFNADRHKHFLHAEFEIYSLMMSKIYTEWKQGCMYVASITRSHH